MAAGRSWDGRRAFTGWPQGTRRMAAGRLQDGHGASAGWPQGVRGMAAGYSQDADGWGTRKMAAGRLQDGRRAFAGWPRGVRRIAAGRSQDGCGASEGCFYCACTCQSQPCQVRASCNCRYSCLKKLVPRDARSHAIANWRLYYMRWQCKGSRLWDSFDNNLVHGR